VGGWRGEKAETEEAREGKGEEKKEGEEIKGMAREKRVGVSERERTYHIGILLNTAIAAEKPHPAHTGNALLDPRLLVLIRLVHQRVRLDIAVEIIRDEVVIAVLGDAVA